MWKLYIQSPCKCKMFNSILCKCIIVKGHMVYTSVAQFLNPDSIFNPIFRLVLLVKIVDMVDCENWVENQPLIFTQTITSCEN